MDNELRIPYYFPPQRYIPRLGGMGAERGANNPISGLTEGLQSGLELYMQLQGAKEAKGQREQDKRDQQQYRQDELNLRSRQEDRQDTAESAAQAQRLADVASRAGIFYDPRSIGTAASAKAPVDLQLGSFGGPQADQGLRAQQESGLMQRGATALQQAKEGNKVVPFQGGFAEQPPSYERNELRMSEAGAREYETKLRLAGQSYDNWMHNRGVYAGQRLQEYRAQHPYGDPSATTPQEDGLDTSIIGQSQRQYEMANPKPTFTPDIERSLGHTSAAAPAGHGSRTPPNQPNPDNNPAAPGHTENAPAGVDSTNAAAYHRRVAALKKP